MFYDLKNKKYLQWAFTGKGTRELSGMVEMFSFDYADFLGVYLKLIEQCLSSITWQKKMYPF